VHGWWNLGGAKMSKTAGNIVDPNTLVQKYGADAVRYYLMTDIVTGKDADFSEERLVERYNAELANDLGNLLNRVAAMANQYRSGKIIHVKQRAEGLLQFAVLVDQKIDSCREAMDGGAPEYPNIEPFHVEDALRAARAITIHCNRFIDNVQPWKLAKSSLDQDALQLDAILYGLVDVIRVIAILLSPVLPKAAHGIFDQLNWKMELSGKEERFRLDDAKWGGLPDGHVVGKPVPLFPRIETE